jgi:ABC-type glutathione transport system ATPase component
VAAPSKTGAALEAYVMAEAAAATGLPLVEVRDLRKHFPVTKGVLFQRAIGQVKAVDGVSFSIRRREALGLVGESGCGKSTIARCLLKLLAPSGGSIHFDGADIGQLDKGSTLAFRRQVQAIFQDPYSSLNPRMKWRRSWASRFTCTADRRRRPTSSGRFSSFWSFAACPGASPIATPTR